MKTEEELDQITRSLLKDAAEQPSKDLAPNIMRLIFMEKTKQAPFTVSAIPRLASLIIGFCVYMFLIVGGMSLYARYGNMLQGLADNKAFFTLIFVVISAGSFFLFFTTFDNWLHLKERKS